MSLEVFFDGQDISDQVLNAVNVRREERAAGLADFTWSPDLIPDGPGTQLVVLDNFDNADGTLLENHTPDTGPQWVRFAGLFAVRDATGAIPQGARGDIDSLNQYRCPYVLSLEYTLSCDVYLSELNSNEITFFLQGIWLELNRGPDFRIRIHGGPVVLTETLSFSTTTDLSVRFIFEFADGGDTINWEVREGNAAASVPVSSGTVDVSAATPFFDDIFIQSSGLVVLAYLDVSEPTAQSFAATPPLPYELIGKPVQIFYSGEQLYFGFVNTAEWDMLTRTFAISCSDLLQRVFAGLDTAAIVALIPGGRWSASVFGEQDDSEWQIAQDVMSTVDLDVHKSRFGVYRTVPRAAKTTPDRILTETEILDGGAYDLDLLVARDIVTRSEVVFTYQYSRWKMRLHDFGWSYSIGQPFTSFCDYLTVGGLFPVPAKQTVLTAVQGTGWPVFYDPTLAIGGDGVKFTEFPEGGDFCGGPIWAIDDASREIFAIGASWTGYRLFAQTIREVYTLTFDAVAAQGTFGVLEERQEFSGQVDADDSAFESSDAPPDVLKAGAGWSADAIGDWTQDQIDETRRTNDLACAIGLFTTQLREIFRGNSVAVETAIDPTLDLPDTVLITTPDIDARGKVRTIEHRIDRDRALTRVTVAVSTGGGGTDGDTSVPARPPSQPVHPAPSDKTTLSTYLGGCEDDDPFDEEWMGWTTNRRVCTSQPATSQDKIYPLRFRVRGPDIENEARQDFEASMSRTIEVSIPQDTLVLK